MNKGSVRVRFAPSPSGFMHLGNVRTAIMNYLFARQKNGTFILRIEDTDPQRNFDPEGIQILKDLAWLELSFDEGPDKGGPYSPYFQSKRFAQYTDALHTLQEKQLVYPCFCTSEELEKKRQRQLALKQPPRYDRGCLKLTKEQVKENFQTEVPFIWRFKLDHDQTVTFYDLAHKTMHFELKHFSDVPVTRQDGSFTFLFANLVDDVAMKITHVFRGEDHLTNTAAQVALYEAFQEEVPVFWHMPILCNKEGKKLSKRDFGFGLNDLKKEGILPEAIVNYLGIIGRSVPNEIMNAQELIDSYNFDHLSPTGHIKYDVDKLRWVNHHWIMGYDLDKLTELCRPFIQEAHPSLGALSHDELKALIAPLQEELITLKQSAEALAFIPVRPVLDNELLAQYNFSNYKQLLIPVLSDLPNKAPEEGYEALKVFCRDNEFSIKDIFALIRIALTGKAQGPSVKDLLGMLSPQEIKQRLDNLTK